MRILIIDDLEQTEHLLKVFAKRIKGIELELFFITSIHNLPDVQGLEEFDFILLDERFNHEGANYNSSPVKSGYEIFVAICEKNPNLETKFIGISASSELQTYIPEDRRAGKSYLSLEGFKKLISELDLRLNMETSENTETDIY